MMRIMGAALMAGTLFAAQPVLAQEAQEQPQSLEISATSLALAREIVDLGFPEDTREAIFFATGDQMEAQVRDAMMKALPDLDEGAIAILDEWIAEMNAKSKAILRRHIPGLIEGMARSYAVIFTEQELRDILGFVSTPSGQRFFELSAAVMGESNFAAANQAYMDEAFADMPAAQQDLVARLRDYFANKDQRIEADDPVS